VWRVGAACLILCAHPSASRAAAAPAKPAEAVSSKPSAAAPGKPSAAPGSKPSAAPAGRSAARSEGSVGALENSHSATDSTFGGSEARTPRTAAGAPAGDAAVAAGKGAQRPAAGVTPAPTAARPARASSAAKAAPGPTPARLAAPGVGKTRGIQTVANLDQNVTYQYNALGRRDPFQPMIGGEFVGVDVGGDAPVDVGGMKVVGIVWGTEDKFAMVEDGRGQSLVLRVGDKVMNGVVEGLRRDAVVVRITADGQTQSVAIPLTRKGDKSNATR
jgi:hypothetical protein